MMIHTDNLKPNDTVLKRNKANEVIDVCTLKQKVPTLSCTGYHFMTVGGSLVCYGRGIVEIAGRRQ